ncbi:hypothetical protein ACIG87_21710 [Micromonospora sp. NPDC051925]|uniref:hypothetical protein n=1 Tax=Micromonospora sp. NPDC051925 TaxID=3364288 RepID=UPI0037CA6EEA
MKTSSSTRAAYSSGPVMPVTWNAPAQRAPGHLGQQVRQDRQHVALGVPQLARREPTLDGQPRGPL